MLLELLGLWLAQKSVLLFLLGLGFITFIESREVEGTNPMFAPLWCGTALVMGHGMWSVLVFIFTVVF